MALQTLPRLTRSEVESHNTKKSLYVTIGLKVYDVTEFADDHPGGPELLLEYAGKDVGMILQDDVSHIHTDTAYEILEECVVGLLATENSKSNRRADKDVAEATGLVLKDEDGREIHPRTGMSCEEDLNKETDYTNDYKTHKFLDLNRPLFKQVWFGGFSKEFYLDQVHRPRHYKGGQSAPLFGNFLEPLTKTPWWVIPTLWLPPVAYGLYRAGDILAPTTVASYFGLGLFIWTFIEYCLHRFLFHLDGYLPDNRVGITMHFTLHGIHHYLPMDRYRLVMPPTLFVVLATPFWKLAHFLFSYSWHAATAVYCGGIFGYICYDLTHYFLHHRNLPLWYKGLKKYHLAHHFLDYELGFGVTSRFWDTIFGTELPTVVKAK